MVRNVGEHPLAIDVPASGSTSVRVVGWWEIGDESRVGIDPVEVLELVFRNVASNTYRVAAVHTTGRIANVTGVGAWQRTVPGRVAAHWKGRWWIRWSPTRGIEPLQAGDEVSGAGAVVVSDGSVGGCIEIGVPPSVLAGVGRVSVVGEMGLEDWVIYPPNMALRGGDVLTFVGTQRRERVGDADGGLGGGLLWRCGVGDGLRDLGYVGVHGGLGDRVRSLDGVLDRACRIEVEAERVDCVVDDLRWRIEDEVPVGDWFLPPDRGMWSGDGGPATMLTTSLISLGWFVVALAVALRALVAETAALFETSLAGGFAPLGAFVRRFGAGCSHAIGAIIDSPSGGVMGVGGKGSCTYSKSYNLGGLLGPISGWSASV